MHALVALGKYDNALSCTSLALLDKFAILSTYPRRGSSIKYDFKPISTVITTRLSGIWNHISNIELSKDCSTRTCTISNTQESRRGRQNLYVGFGGNGFGGRRTQDSRTRSLRTWGNFWSWLWSGFGF